MADNRSSRRLPNELFWETAKWARLEHYERNLLENGAARLLVGAAFGVYLRQHCNKLKVAKNKMAQPMRAKCRICNAYVDIADQMNHIHQCTARQAMLDALSNALFTIVPPIDPPLDSLDEATSTAALSRKRGAETEAGTSVSEPPPNKKSNPESSNNDTSTGTQSREEEEESIATSPPTESDPHLFQLCIQCMAFNQGDWMICSWSMLRIQEFLALFWATIFNRALVLHQTAMPQMTGKRMKTRETTRTNK